MPIALVSFIICGSTQLGRCTKKSKLMRAIEPEKIVEAEVLYHCQQQASYLFINK
jgi:hypothetical protein